MTHTEGPVRYTEQDRQAGCPLVHTVCAAGHLPVTDSTEDAGLNRGSLSQEHQYCEEEDVSQEMSGRLTSKDSVLSEQQVLLNCPLRSGALCTHTAQSPWDPSLPLHTSVARREVPVSSDLKKSSCGGPREARLNVCV